MIEPPAGWFERACRSVNRQDGRVPEPLETDRDRAWALAIRAAMDHSMPKWNGSITHWQNLPGQISQEMHKRAWEGWSKTTGEPLPWSPSVRTFGPFVKPERLEQWLPEARAHLARHNYPWAK